MASMLFHSRRAWMRAVSVLSVVAGSLASAAIVWQASHAAFSATTTNPNDTWAAGSIVLSDDDSNAAMFSASNLKPSSSGSNCIAVTSTGTLPAAVKLYATGASTTRALSSYINLTITMGTGGGYGTCAGFTPLATGSSVYSGTLAAFSTSAVDYSTGLGSWAPTGTPPESMVYQIAYTMSGGMPNGAQSGTASVSFTWESQNT